MPSASLPDAVAPLKEDPQHGAVLLDIDGTLAPIVEHASDDVSSEMQLRVIAYWTRVDEQIGARVAAGLGHGNGSSPNGQLREAQELIDARAGTA